MKRSIAWFIAVLGLMFSTSALALPEHPFHMRAGIYPAFGPGSPNAFGIGALTEPSLALTEQFSIGARLDGGALFAIAIGNSQNVSAGLRVHGAGLIKVEFAFTQTDVRPFVGVGAGLYYMALTAGGTNGASAVATSLLGVLPELGIDFGGFRLAALYHGLFGQTGSASSLNFFGLELSWQIS